MKSFENLKHDWESKEFTNDIYKAIMDEIVDPDVAKLTIEKQFAELHRE